MRMVRTWSKRETGGYARRPDALRLTNHGAGIRFCSDMFAYVRIFREIFARRRERSVGALGAGVSKPEDYHWIKVDKGG